MFDPHKSQIQKPNLTNLTTHENSTVYRIFPTQNLEQNIEKLTQNFQNLKVNINHTITNLNLKNNTKMSLNSDNSNHGAGENCANDVFKSLRIPDAIKDLPRYEGSRHTLYEFIENVEEILTLCNDIDGHPSSKIFLRAIRNKIVGEANEVLTMYGTPLEWDAIKNNLITHYADKRNETNLVRDLYNISQGHDTLEKYFARIIDIQSTIINHIKLNENSAIIIRAKRDLYEEMCLNTFLAGLREPLGSMIRAMQPTSLAEAFTNCLKEQNMTYMKKGTSSSTNILPIPQRSIPQKLGNIYPSRNNYPSGPPILQSSNPSRNYYPNGPPMLQARSYPHYHQRPTPQYYNHKPFTNQNPNMNGNSHPNFNNNNRFGSKPPMVPPRRAEPMDTTSNANQYKQYTYPNRANNNYQFQATGPAKFRAQELYTCENQNNQEEEVVAECYEEEPQLYFPDLDEGEVDDENFHPEASHPESDT